MNHRITQGWLIAGGMLLVAAPYSASQAQEFKVGYVNVRTVFDNYQRTKALDAGLESKGKQKEAELEGKMNELKKMRQNLELLNDQAREAKAREIEARADELKRFRNNTARDLQRERDAAAEVIRKDIKQAIDEYAQANGFTMVFDGSALIYGQDGPDLTDEVLSMLNSRGGKSKSE